MTSLTTLRGFDLFAGFVLRCLAIASLMPRDLPTMLLIEILRAADHLHAGLDLGFGRRDQLLDLAGRVGGALRQRPDFLRDDGKTTAAFAGTRRLDAGIQRQKVGLEGDLVDDADDLADLFGRSLDIGHGGNRLAGDLAAVLGGCARRGGGLFGSAAVGRHRRGRVGDGGKGRGGVMSAPMARPAACRRTARVWPASELRRALRPSTARSPSRLNLAWRRRARRSAGGDPR